VNKDKRPQDLSVEELRRLLLDKRRVTRKDRLEHFRRSGRAVLLAPDIPEEPVNHLRSMLVVDTADSQEADENPKETRRSTMDRVLLGVEIIAFIGLIGVILAGVGLLRTLNSEVVSAIQQPTLTATPLITAVVLPSGHTPPNASGGAQFNESEIPEHLRPLVQSLANVPIPTPGLAQAIRIQIPAIGVDAPVVQGDGWEQLKKGVAQHLGTGDPGENGNVVLSAHNDIFGQLFRDLDKLQPGDQIILFTNQRQYIYSVTATLIVEPTSVEVMNATPNPIVTLISCYPYLVDNQRIVVTASLQNP
jgi:sortase A